MLEWKERKKVSCINRCEGALGHVAESFKTVVETGGRNPSSMGLNLGSVRVEEHIAVKCRK